MHAVASPHSVALAHYDAPPASPQRELTSGLFALETASPFSSGSHLSEDRSASPDSRRGGGGGELYKAAGKGVVEIVERLLDGGSELASAIGRHGDTALHNAAKHNHAGVCKLLLTRGASPSVVSEERLTPLHTAAGKGALASLAVLLEHVATFGIASSTALVNARDAEGRTALHLSASAGHTEACEALTKAGASLSVRDEEGEAALHLACSHGHYATAAMLIALGADVNLALESGTGDDEEHDFPTPLHSAAGAGEDSCVAMLLVKGARVDTFDAAHCTALMRAAGKGREACLETLLKGAANVALVDQNGRTALHKAASHGKSSVVKLLLDARAPTDLCDSHGQTPLLAALTRADVASVSLLLPYHTTAAARGACLQAVVQGAQKDASYAKECLEILLANGGELLCNAADAKAALETAKAADMRELIALLQRFNSTPSTSVTSSPSMQVEQSHRRPSNQSQQSHSSHHLSSSSSSPISANTASSSTTPPRAVSPQRGAPLSQTLSASASLLTRASEGSVSGGASAPPRDYSPQRPTQAGGANDKLSAYVKRFNAKPKDGVEAMIGDHVIDSTPASLARFLHETSGLSKEKVGEYLGNRDHTALLRAFMEGFDFAGLTFDGALRRYLSKFRLPGEAQVIDRFMVAFASRYCGANEGHPFANEDAAYILAFSLIMLNTDRHNPNVKRKMTKDEFTRTNRGINGGSDLPPDFLESLFDAIVRDEIKLDGSNAMFSNAERKGMLTKQGGRVKSWKSRWFVLTDNCLYYFRTEKDSQPLGIIPLENLAVRVVAQKDKHVFELFHPDHEELKACKMNSDKALVRGNHESYLIRATTREDMDEWVRCLETNIQSNPLLELINKRKKLAQAAVHGPASPAPRAEFRELLTAAQLCLAASKGAEYFRNKFGESAVFSFSRAQCFLTSHASTKTHQIVVMSRLDEGEELRQALLLCKDLSAFKAFSLVEHYEFRQTATDIYNRIKTSLNRDYSITIAAHSFGAVVAIMLGLHLHTATWKIAKVITFGQPRFLSEKGVQAVSVLPLLRVTDSRDIVHCAFPLLFHCGAELLLLSDPYYHLNEKAPQQRDLKQSMLEEKALNAALAAHAPESFVKRLQARLQSSKPVTDIEVNMYM